MTADGIAIVWATVVTPLVAIAISIWYQERKQRREAKLNVFFRVMAHRKSMPPPIEWVQALNLIDVVFHDSKAVKDAWHSLFEYVHVVPMNENLYEQKKIDLLTEMANNLGYTDLKQTDIDKFYHPQGHGDQAKLNLDLQTEFLRVLQSSKSFSSDK